MTPPDTSTWNSTGSGAADSLLNGDLFDLLTKPAENQLGEGLIALFLVAIIILPLMARGEDPFLPAIMLVLFSGVLVPILPGSMVGVAWGVIWISGTIALTGFANRLR